jgi:hypothetical protein
MARRATRQPASAPPPAIRYAWATWGVGSLRGLLDTLAADPSPQRRCRSLDGTWHTVDRLALIAAVTAEIAGRTEAERVPW